MKWPADGLSQMGFASHAGSGMMGKTHLVSALAYEACLRDHSVLFTTAVDIINTLTAAQTTGWLKTELKRYLKPAILLVDELGYLPIDKTGADLLFQVISQRYEQGSILLTTNQPYKHWPRAVQVKLWPDFENIQHSTFNAQHSRNERIERPWELNVEC